MRHQIFGTLALALGLLAGLTPGSLAAQSGPPIAAVVSPQASTIQPQGDAPSARPESRGTARIGLGEGIVAPTEIAAVQGQPTNAVINTGDSAWLLAASALVLMMTLPGISLFYAGLVRKKNLLSIFAQCFGACCVASIMWVALGYSLAFSAKNEWIGGVGRIMLQGLSMTQDPNRISVHPAAPHVPESVFLVFQMMFAIITPALIVGAFAERMKFFASMIFVALWSVAVYAPIAHWVWEPGGWMAKMGVLDYAGGTVVHINAGVSALVAAIIIGPRIGYGREAMAPHNLALTITGAGLLWVGWLGFNGGAAGGANAQAGLAIIMTQLAAASGAMTWMVVEWVQRGRVSVLGLVSGAIAGLVAITPAAGYTDAAGALIFGIAAGIFAYLGATSLKARFGYDDSLDVFGIHAVAGIVGALLTGVLSVRELAGHVPSLSAQAIGAGATLLYSGIVTGLILILLDALIGLRVSDAEERDGLDAAQHGEHVA